MLDRTNPTKADETLPLAEPAYAGSHRSWVAPFHIRSFRFQWPADLLTSWAFEMENLILGWYILVETKSVILLTVFGALQYVGTLVAPMMGVASDRIGHRTVLCAMRATYAALALTLMILAFAGAVTPMNVLVISGIMGIVRPSDMGIRSALVAETMPSDRLIAAMSASRTTTDMARIAGALAGAGLFAAFGMGPAYVLVFCCYAGAALLLLGIEKPRRHISVALAPDGADPSSPWRDLKDGLAQVWNTPLLLAMMWLAFLANLTIFPILNGMLPYVAKDVYALNQTGLSYLVAGLAGGALLGSIGLSRAATGIHLTRVAIIWTTIWYALLLAFAQMQGAFGGFVLLTLLGFAQSLSMVPLSIILLRAAGEKFRGRVMGVRMMAIYSLPLGLLAGGFLIEWYGFRAMASAYAIVGLVFTLVVALRWRAQLWHVS